MEQETNKPVYTLEEVIKKCQEADWLKIGSEVFEDDPAFEQDSPYSLVTLNTIEELERRFSSGCWSIRQAFAYKQLLFINQVNAGDEWWTCWKYEDGRIRDFESISFVPIIRDNEFEETIDHLLQGPDKYWAD